MKILTVHCAECEMPMPVVDVDMDFEKRKVKANLWCYACQIEYILILVEGKAVMMVDRRDIN